MRRAVVTLFLMLSWMGGVFAAPPTIEARPALGDALIQGYWQPLVITLKNPDTGEPIQGEVQVAVQDQRSSALLASYIKPVTLPRGMGETQVALDLYVPQMYQPEIMVYVVSGRDGKGQVVTRKRFDKIPVRLDPLTMLAVTQTPDALAYLQSEGLGVQRTGGVLRPAAPASAPGMRSRGSGYEEAVKVQHLSDPASLPDRTIGYDMASLVYIGPDIPSAAISDSQVEALRLWVAKGGAVVFHNNRLRTDERFRPWLPTLAGEERIVSRKVGRGATIGLAYDPAMPDYAGTPGAVTDWRRIARLGVAPMSIGDQLQDDRMYGNGATFQQSVLRAPGMQAPGIGAIGLFLVGYILLLVPINYAVLKRLDKREWTWVTVPVLVTLFSLGAYWFGLSTKGSQTIQNAATLIEMTAGSGDTQTAGVIGIFSPSKSRYRIDVDTPDTMLWATSGGYGYRSNDEYGALAVQERDKAGARIRDAEISMWAMRAFNVRSHTLRLGDGLIAHLSVSRKRDQPVRRRRGRQPDEILTLTGTLENRTGKRLENVRLVYMGSVVTLNTLEANQKVPVNLTANSRLNSGKPDFLGNFGAPSTYNSAGKLTIEATRGAIIYDVSNAIRDQIAGGKLDTPTAQAFITAWNFDPLLPITVNGEKVPTGANVNLVLCRAPVRDSGNE